jgi:lipoprotein-anchoring transpeptidase ErfK/SrfK
MNTLKIRIQAKEQLIGQAASRGCIRMRNQGAIQLFDLIDVGTEVEILP